MSGRTAAPIVLASVGAAVAWLASRAPIEQTWSLAGGSSHGIFVLCPEIRDDTRVVQFLGGAALAALVFAIALGRLGGRLWMRVSARLAAKIALGLLVLGVALFPYPGQIDLPDRAAPAPQQPLPPHTVQAPAEVHLYVGFPPGMPLVTGASAGLLISIAIAAVLDRSVRISLLSRAHLRPQEESPA